MEVAHQLNQVSGCLTLPPDLGHCTWNPGGIENFIFRCTYLLMPSVPTIVSQLTPPGTPQWNGVSERRNRTLLDMVRSMMSHSDLLTSFWGYALETAAFTLNRVPSKSVQKTPYEIWTGKRPSMSFMKIWGCKAYVKHQMSTKLEPKSHKCTFVGYPKKQRYTISSILKRTKCLLLERESSLKRTFSQKGIQEILNLEKFNNNKSLNRKLNKLLKILKEVQQI